MRASRSLQLLLAAALVSGAVTVPAQAQFGGLGGIVDRVRTVKNVADATRAIGEPEEIAIGTELAGVILGAAPLVDNPAQQHYVNRLGTWLALHSERPNLPWRFGIVDTDDVNAFSTPGGHVLITRGMFDRMRNESELAGVLAHEIAHVVQKHHLQAIQSAAGSAALTDVGQSVVSSEVGGVAGMVSGPILNAGKNIMIRGLDKADEYEADRMGVVIAARAGYSPYGLVGVLQTLAAAGEKGGMALLFKTHPKPSDRLERLDRAMGTRLDGLDPVVDDLPTFAALRPVLTPAASDTVVAEE